MPNQFLSDEFGDIEDYFVTDYWLIDNFVGDSLWVFGRNNIPQLGTNNNTNQFTPVTTFAGGTNWKQVSGGREHTAAIKTDGTLWTWGGNASGEIGNFASTTRSTPVTTFIGGNDWKQVSANQHNAAIKTDGSLWTWGAGAIGQLGNFATTNRSTPVTTFIGGNTWKQVACGGVQTAAIKTDGTLWTWGGTIELGINVGGGTRNTPVTTFAGGTTWKQVSCGYQYTAAIKTDGSLWVWGQNGNGQLGINAAGTRSTPVTTFAGGNNWKQVACGHEHTIAIKTDGSLWTWGNNGNGQLGNFSTTNRSTPVTTFAGGTNWKQGSGGISHTGAIKTDGTLWTWGLPNEGRLGNNTGSVTRSTPVTTFAGGNNWKQVAAGREHTAAVKSGLNVDLS